MCTCTSTCKIWRQLALHLLTCHCTLIRQVSCDPLKYNCFVVVVVLTCTQHGGPGDSLLHTFQPPPACLFVRWVVICQISFLNIFYLYINIMDLVIAGITLFHLPLHANLAGELWPAKPESFTWTLACRTLRYLLSQVPTGQCMLILQMSCDLPNKSLLAVNWHAGPGDSCHHTFLSASAC